MYHVEYIEAEADVDQQMIVSVSGWPAKLLDKGGINNLKMKVTKSLLLEFSVHSVLQGEIFAVYGTPEPGTAEAEIVERILNNTKAPGYFVHPEGFVSCFDQIPEGFSSEFIDLTGLSPYMPNEITNLNLQFK
ncbi:MAG: hypothetical protein ACOCXH_00200 [Cyclobacteriaceae bacterium]